jgi:protein gp37
MPTSISWATDSWNPFVGCSLASPGCTNCYAMHQAARILRMQRSRGGASAYEGAITAVKGQPVWTGRINQASEKARWAPLSWLKPRTIFVGSMSDFFHPSALDAWRIEALAIAALTQRHIYLILTKRGADMHRFISDPATAKAVWTRASEIAIQRNIRPERMADMRPGHWPLDNVALGVSVEDQKRADERIPVLLATPAARRFVSAEPLLGQVDLSRICRVPKVAGSVRAGIHINALEGMYCESGRPYIGEWDINGPYPSSAPAIRLDLVIAGGENDRGYRLTHPDWVRRLRDACERHGTKFHFKQWGAWAPVSELPGEQVSEFWDLEAHVSPSADVGRTRLIDRAGRVYRHDQQTAAEAGAIMMLRFGTAHSGRSLDGRTHDEVLGAGASAP